MKKICKHIVFWVILFSLCLSSCSTGGGRKTTVSSTDGKCRDFICVEISIAEPIVLNQPIDVIIKIQASKNQPDLVVVLIASPSGKVEFAPDKVWYFDAQAEQELTFTSTVTFTAPGGWQVAAQVGFVQGGFIVGDFDRVIIDEDGTAHLNPTPGPYPTSDVLQPATPDPQIQTATVAAEATAESLSPRAVGFTPQELIEKCGWSVDQPESLTEWSEADIRIAFDLPEMVTLDQWIEENYVIGYNDQENEQALLPIKVGLCPLKGWVADRPSIWEHDLQSGIALIDSVKLHFVETGIIPMMLVVLDKQNQRVASVGMLVQVLTAEDYQEYQDQQLLPTESTSEFIPDPRIKSDRSITTTEIMDVTVQWRTFAQETYDTVSWPAGSPLWEVRDITANDQLIRKRGFEERMPILCQNQLTTFGLNLGHSE
ncbi:MAG: hypothetical protein CVU39_08225 [Chloroflexi bacterium HGW-Chloroflexi-10]|nr:MAG: hypothetical protein CVU39_08225 [Chloroflexi bacterium HGW-Chloroflexi-10]